MTKPRIVLARVISNNGVFINSVLHQAGELLRVDLDELGLDSLDGNKQLEEVAEGDGESVSTVAIASVAPRAPGADMAQGMPTGSIHSGTGRIIMPGAGDSGGSVEVRPDTTEEEIEADPPIRRDSDIDPIEKPNEGQPRSKSQVAHKAK